MAMTPSSQGIRPRPTRKELLHNIEQRHVRDDYQLAKHIMLLAIAAAAGPFIINGAMQFTKWLTSVSTTGGKRFLLAILAILGAIAYSALNGTPLDVNSLTSLGQVMAIEALAAFLAAHGSYSLLTGKTAPSEIPNA
jgi:hypothetical protein